MNTPIELQCPTCKKIIQWTEAYPYRPFCSHRCQLLDLGDWANERYSFPSNENDQDE